MEPCYNSISLQWATVVQSLTGATEVCHADKGLPHFKIMGHQLNYPIKVNELNEVCSLSTLLEAQ